MFCLACVLVPLLLVLYILCDVNYFVRTFLVIMWGRLFQKKIKPTDTSTLYGLCTMQDVDVFLKHMNNARYMRECDFARFHFYDRSGLYAEAVKRKAILLQGATSVRYRRPIPIFTAFKTTTKLVHWDDKSLYLEQQFISLSDGFVRATLLSKQSYVGPDLMGIMRSLTGREPGEAPEEISLWIQALEAASAKLRKKD